MKHWQQVTVTGYSLGGHLATAFAQLRAEAGELSRIQHIYTFSGAGTGGIKPGHSLVRSGLPNRTIQRFPRQGKSYAFLQMEPQQVAA